MKKNWPKVTVILPFFKKIRFFKKTFKSILIQNYKHMEIIIVYDDPNKNELNQINKIIKGYKNVKVVLNKKNIGAGLSRNKGIKNASGKYIAFLDCDDIWKRNKLKKQVAIMKKNNIPFSFTTYEIIGENGNRLNKKIVAKNLNYEKLIKSCDIGLSTVVVEKKLISKFKFPNLLTKEDFVVWLKISKIEAQLIGINQNLCYWRKSHNSLSSSSLQKFLDAYRVFNFFEKKNIFLSFLFTIRLSFNFLLKYYFKIEKRV